MRIDVGASIVIDVHFERSTYGLGQLKELVGLIELQACNDKLENGQYRIDGNDGLIEVTIDEDEIIVQ